MVGNQRFNVRELFREVKTTAANAKRRVKLATKRVIQKVRTILPQKPAPKVRFATIKKETDAMVSDIFTNPSLDEGHTDPAYYLIYSILKSGIPITDNIQMFEMIKDAHQRRRTMTYEFYASLATSSRYSKLYAEIYPGELTFQEILVSITKASFVGSYSRPELYRKYHTVISKPDEGVPSLRPRSYYRPGGNRNVSPVAILPKSPLPNDPVCIANFGFPDYLAKIFCNQVYHTGLKSNHHPCHRFITDNLVLRARKSTIANDPTYRDNRRITCIGPKVKDELEAIAELGIQNTIFEFYCPNDFVHDIGNPNDVPDRDQNGNIYRVYNREWDIEDARNDTVYWIFDVHYYLDFLPPNAYVVGIDHDPYSQVHTSCTFNMFNQEGTLTYFSRNGELWVNQLSEGERNSYEHPVREMSLLKSHIHTLGIYGIISGRTGTQAIPTPPKAVTLLPIPMRWHVLEIMHHAPNNISYATWIDEPTLIERTVYAIGGRTIKKILESGSVRGKHFIVFEGELADMVVYILGILTNVFLYYLGYIRVLMVSGLALGFFVSLMMALALWSLIPIRHAPRGVRLGVYTIVFSTVAIRSKPLFVPLPAVLFSMMLTMVFIDLFLARWHKHDLVSSLADKVESWAHKRKIRQIIDYDLEPPVEDYVASEPDLDHHRFDIEEEDTRTVYVLGGSHSNEDKLLSHKREVAKYYYRHPTLKQEPTGNSRLISHYYLDTRGQECSYEQLMTEDVKPRSADLSRLSGLMIDREYPFEVNAHSPANLVSAFFNRMVGTQLLPDPTLLTEFSRWVRSEITQRLATVPFEDFTFEEYLARKDNFSSKKKQKYRRMYEELTTQPRVWNIFYKGMIKTGEVQVANNLQEE